MAQRSYIYYVVFAVYRPADGRLMQPGDTSLRDARQDNNEYPEPMLRSESNDEIRLFDYPIASLEQIRAIEDELITRQKGESADVVLLNDPRLLRIEEWDGKEWVDISLLTPDSKSHYLRQFRRSRRHRR